MTSTSGVPIDEARPTVYLHIGTMKSGTSFVQNILEHEREGLAADGVLYPGSVGRAVHEILGRRAPRSLGASAGSWADLVASIDRWSGRSAVVSMEFLGLASDEQITTIVESLRPHDVQVVLTARDLVRAIPSAWQQTTKNRQHVTWPDFVRAVTGHGDENPQAAQHFWSHHDAAAIARRWVAAVGADHVTVVTVPAAGSEPAELWRRFGPAVEIDTGRFSASSGGRGNPSLGFAEAEMLRRLNVEIGRQIEQDAYRRLVTGFLSRQVLRGPPDETGAPPTLPPEAHEWARQHGAHLVAELGALGVGVRGDLSDLVAPPFAGDPLHDVSTAASDTAVAAVAVRAAAALLVALAETQRDPSGPLRMM